MQTKPGTRVVILGRGLAEATHKPIRRSETTGRRRATTHRTIVIRNGEMIAGVARG
jgi:hypothetical protein